MSVNRVSASLAGTGGQKERETQKYRHNKQRRERGKRNRREQTSRGEGGERDWKGIWQHRESKGAGEDRYGQSKM